MKAKKFIGKFTKEMQETMQDILNLLSKPSERDQKSKGISYTVIINRLDEETARKYYKHKGRIHRALKRLLENGQIKKFKRKDGIDVYEKI